MAPTRITIEPLNVFERSKAKTFAQLFGFFVITALNVSLIGSDIHRYEIHHEIPLRLELMTFSFLAFLDATTLLPIIFQVKSIKMWDDRIVVQTLFWRSTLKWEQILSVTQPRNFTLLIMKTKRMFYLINRKDFPEIEIFLSKVKEKFG